MKLEARSGSEEMRRERGRVGQGGDIFIRPKSLRQHISSSATSSSAHLPTPTQWVIETRRLTGVDNDQDPLPPLVDLCELSVLGIEYRGVEVEVVLQCFVSLDDDGSLGILGDFGGKIRHVECLLYGIWGCGSEMLRN